MKKNTRAMRKRQLYTRMILGMAALAVILAVVLIAVSCGRQKKDETQEAAPAGAESAAVLAGKAEAGESAAVQAAEAAAEGGPDGTGEGNAASGTAPAEPAPSAKSTPAGSVGSTPAGRVSIKLTATGDCTLGIDDSFDYDTSFNAAYYEADYPGWFFENCMDSLGSDDLTIVNFEGVLSEGGERQEKQYAFRGDPEFVRVLTEGSVEAANLANNHSFDYGKDAYEDTKKILADAGITTFGYDRSVIVEINGIKVGLTGTLTLYDEWEAKDGLVEQIEWCRDQGAQLIISSIHWGDEGEYYPADWQFYLGRAAVDAGADLVIGHHPHRLQPYEIYKGKVILYSLGNFCFGGHRSPSDMDSAIYRQTFTFENGVLLEDTEYSILPISISSASDYNNYQPTPLYGEEAERALGKIYRLEESGS